jgi:hypothetical protein
MPERNAFIPLTELSDGWKGKSLPPGMQEGMPGLTQEHGDGIIVKGTE